MLRDSKKHISNNIPKKIEPDEKNWRIRVIKDYQQKYLEQLDLKDNHELLKLVNKSQDFGKLSSKNRIVFNTQILKYIFVLPKTQTITTCLKVTRKTTSCIYGYFHAECDINNENNEYRFIPKFVCSGPSFESKDGEYRGRFILWEQFIKIMEVYSDIFTDVEDLIINRMLDREMLFQTDFYYPTCFNEQYRIGYENYINNTRLPVKLFIISWFYDNYMWHFKDAFNHINPAYDWIFNRPDDNARMKEIFNKMGTSTPADNIMGDVLHYVQRVGIKPNIKGDLRYTGVGQKLLTVKLNELKNPDNINYDTWREIYISTKASNLVLNLISPGFPILVSWFYIQNTQAGIFDNFAMHEKYKHSKIASEQLRELKAADDLSYMKDVHDATIPLSNKFIKVSKEIRDDIAFMSSELVISKASVCMLTEYVGRTIHDLPSILMYRNHPAGFEQVFTLEHVLTKHIFEFLYNFYVLSSRMGIIHGDPHMNNATLRWLYYITDDVIKNPHVAYIVKDKQYVFPHSGWYSTVIDFSRSILGDKITLRKDFGKPFTKQFLINQRPHVIATINKYLPILISKHGKEIDTALDLKHALVFKALSSLDAFVFCSHLLTFLNKEEVFSATVDHVNPTFEKNTIIPHPKHLLYIYPSCKDLLKRISARAEQMTIENITAIVEKRLNSVDEFEWPCLTLISEFFEDYVFESTDQYNEHINICDVFNSNFALKYDISTSDEWGPLLTADFEEYIKPEYGMEISKEYTDWLKHKNLDETDAIEEIIAPHREPNEYPQIFDEDWKFID